MLKLQVCAVKMLGLIALAERPMGHQG